jgi:hypothetical protein
LGTAGSSARIAGARGWTRGQSVGRRRVARAAAADLSLVVI